jgi:hypothetical protein
MKNIGEIVGEEAGPKETRFPELILTVHGYTSSLLECSKLNPR